MGTQNERLAQDIKTRRRRGLPAWHFRSVRWSAFIVDPNLARLTLL